ncbi:nucleotidyltransferase domain-containing protein [Brevundimonas sp.]|uniref:nucleotidyltransferase family protein n=1 Tax=Brevundimonas sp. TaxID=1871086 RepID=UPI0025BF8F9F|nr:nucleotidyltransferase domain-containing protein [Brevundimonas sp.]
MFEDDRSRILRITELLEFQRTDVATEAQTAGDNGRLDVLWFRLGAIDRLWSGLSAAYRARHPQISQLGLPTEEQIFTQLAMPPKREIMGLAEKAISAFTPICANPPPPPSVQARCKSPTSRRDAVVEALRRLEPELRSMGVEALYLFGSVARGEDGPDSDIDVAYDVAPAVTDRFGLIDREAVAKAVTDAVGGEVDLVARSGLYPDVAERVAKDLVVLFK